MSHKTSLRSTISNKHYLCQALDKLGFTYKVADTTNGLVTEGRYGVREKVDILITGNGTNNFNDAIGFKLEENGTYTAIGDFFGLRTADNKSVTMDYLTQECCGIAKEGEIYDRLTDLDFTTQDRTEENGVITLTMNRWVA